MHSTRYCSLLIFTTLLIASIQAMAQAGQLDPTFGQGGIVTTDFGNSINSNIATANAVTIQPDGKIVVCGGIPGSKGFPVPAVVRYNTDGSVDTAFGSSGIASTPSEEDISASAIALQSDGKIVVSGFGNAIVVIRFTSNGTLDPTFGNNGIVTASDIFFNGTQTGLALQSDGKIVVAGSRVMERYLPNGQSDSTFGKGNGVLLAGDAANALAVLPNGKILVASTNAATDFGPASGWVTRYNSNGSLDASFGIDGQLGATGLVNAMALLSTGEFLIAGSLTSNITGPITGFAVSRDFGVGFPDPKFATHGAVVTPIANFPNIATSGLGVQLGGDIVVLGTASAANLSNPVFALARYTPAGQLDTTFGTNGIVTTSFSGTNVVTAGGLTIQSDGKIVAVGSYEAGQDDTGFKLARYLGQ